MRTRLMMVVLLLGLPSSAPALARNIFIAPTGNDTTGTRPIGQPYATLTKAVCAAQAGDTIQMRGGWYQQHLYVDEGGDGAAWEIPHDPSLRRRPERRDQWKLQRQYH